MASKLNAEYNQDLKAAYARIMAHPKIVGIASNIGTTCRDLDMEIYKHDLENRGPHRFDGNVFMVALKLHDGVPVSRKNVMEWKDKYYAEATGSLPADMPYAFNIALAPLARAAQRTHPNEGSSSWCPRPRRGMPSCFGSMRL